MLQLLRSGVKSDCDYILMLKTSVMKFLSSYWASKVADEKTNQLIMLVVESWVSIPNIAFDLYRNHAVLPWLLKCYKTTQNDNAKQRDLLLNIIIKLSASLLSIATEHPKGGGFDVILCNEVMLVCVQLLDERDNITYDQDVIRLLELLSDAVTLLDKHKLQKHILLPRVENVRLQQRRDSGGDPLTYTDMLRRLQCGGQGKDDRWRVCLDRIHKYTKSVKLLHRF